MSSELSKRIVSGLILGVAVLFITWWHPVSFAAMCLLGAVILWKEWRNLTRARGPIFLIGGILYIGAAVTSLIALRFLNSIPNNTMNEGVFVILLLFIFVWAGDIGGYVVGKLIGRHKIAPSISPGKSWEGLAGSIGFTALTLYLLSSVTRMALPWWVYVLTAAIVSTIGLAGDLFESSLKRHAGVKDSGALIPGHGGLFDRVDALMPVSILFGVVYYVLPLVRH